MEVSFENAKVLYIPIFSILFLAIFHFYKSRPKPICLLDYACFRPPSFYRAPLPRFLEHASIVFKDKPKITRFQMRILERAGLGPETCLPPAIHYIPPEPTTELARAEARLVIFSAIDEVFSKTGLGPKDVDILITNCSIFCPSPSLSSMIVNKYKMRSTIKTFSLSGMGCSASPISVDLASRFLQLRPNSNALVISTEIITPNCYMGNERAKYRLLHVVRTHKGSEDRAYNSVAQEEDVEGRLGISLSKELIVIAGEALTSNITTLGPLVLPVSEMVRFAYNFIARKILGSKKIKSYVPNFNQVFDHFCVHTGGRAVIDEIQTGLRLLDRQVEASRMILYRFGNTSSSSIWYELSYIEVKGRMKKGDRAWQIAFGSGFKCNSAIWQCNRNIKVKTDGYGPWRDCIDKYPICVPEILNW
ncbi:hypothetical protein Cgig2_022390 [Carnegiea gigantea]|uniref:3-ketoacyl-CoA synthase n=1 Tax=Carnegiea gigantea TaxID=171969 RepID=A0A9Q1KFW3_9CARY|nr:hypothetical protein Cgig2_022390 [Carnegiea gigantea]